MYALRKEVYLILKRAVILTVCLLKLVHMELRVGKINAFEYYKVMHLNTYVLVNRYGVADDLAGYRGSDAKQE